MSPTATAANTLWWLSNLPAWRRFRRALRQPAATQENLLLSIVRANAATMFGYQHGFEHIGTIEEFRRRVPIRDYAELEPWITQIRNGVPNVLTRDRVTRFAPTAGTTGGRKLIPYTATLQSQFNQAIGPWIVDLFHACPALMRGHAYWSISPVVQIENEASAIPIGFEQDSEYLGGVRKRLVEAVMAVPASLSQITDLDEWRKRTLQYLLAAKDLRLLSIWHGSFLSLLLPNELKDPAELWPKLKLISCWGDAHAWGSFEQLKAQFPNVWVQPKGIIATEAVISIPFAGHHPLAIRSHFFEFVDDAGMVLNIDQLQLGHQYQIVVTTGGGLYRYRLNDRIVVDARLGATPSIRLVGKTNGFSDRFGEKLSEIFVSDTLRQLQSDDKPWPFALLAPDGDRYTLFIEGDVPVRLTAALDVMLRSNPHYAYCRDLGQLNDIRVFKIYSNGAGAFSRRQMSLGQRLGDIKPAALSAMDGWADWFDGQYLDA